MSDTAEAPVRTSDRAGGTGMADRFAAATRGCYRPGNRDERKLAAACVDRHIPDKGGRDDVKMALFAATRSSSQHRGAAAS